MVVFLEINWYTMPLFLRPSIGWVVLLETLSRTPALTGSIPAYWVICVGEAGYVAIIKTRPVRGLGAGVRMTR